MQVFFAQVLSQSRYGNLSRNVRPLVCLETPCLYLEGIVGSYYLKQIAQEACRSLARQHGLEIINNIQVACE